MYQDISCQETPPSQETPPCFRDLRFSDLQILAKTGTPILGSLGGNRAAGEKILRFGTPKIVIPKGESPPQAENFGDFGTPKWRFYKGKSPKRGDFFLEGYTNGTRTKIVPKNAWCTIEIPVIKIAEGDNSSQNLSKSKGFG